MYAEIGDKKKHEEFQKRYTAKRDAEKINKNKSMEKAISIILNNQKEEFLHSRDRVITISVFCGVILLMLLYMMYRKTQKHKKQFDLDLHQTEETIKHLKHQVNESFEEVVHLAKNNSHQFWSRFQEVYPDFLEKMLAINPHLRTSELTNCAYIYLGFSTKEIAEYTFKYPKTIENNRYNLRKKLFLTKHVDLAVYIREYINV